MPDFRRDYKADYDAFEKAVVGDERFCFVRFNDGEFALLQGKPYKAASGWRLRRGAESWLRQPLLDALRARLPGYYIGISSTCCMRKAVPFYRNEIQAEQSNRTFATLFFNYNFARANAFLRKLPSVLVACHKGDFYVPGDGVNRPWDLDDLVTKLLDAQKPILVAGGPCACVIGHRYWERALKRQTQEPGFRPQSLIDIGATLDTLIHGGRTRLYHDASHVLRNHLCTWDGERIRGGMAASAMEPLRPKVHRATGRPLPNSYRGGLTAATQNNRELDIAVKASKGGTLGTRRKKTKEHLRKHLGSGKWARRRLRST